MASDVSPGTIPVASVVQGSQTASVSLSKRGTGLPASGNSEPAAALPVKASEASFKPVSVAKVPVQPTSDPAELVRNLNKYLNDSGLPDQFRLDPGSNGKLIQQINPASGAVIGEFSATEFPALARSVGVAGLLVDSLA